MKFVDDDDDDDASEMTRENKVLDFNVDNAFNSADAPEVAIA